MRLRGDRAHAGTAAAVRDRERLVQVEVGDVTAQVAEAREAEQGVEVGAVDVHLSAGVVHGLRDLEHVVLVHPVGRGVRDHQADSSAACCAIFARRSPRSTLPASSHATTTTFMPARIADAAFVPWADDGMRQTVRSVSPFARW